ncbi:hypothetical protein Tco_0463384, partial [Tanacetum coccineum]
WDGDGGDKGEGGGCGMVKVAVVWRGGGEGWCSWRSTGDRRKLAGIWPDMGRRRRKFNGEGGVC